MKKKVLLAGVVWAVPMLLQNATVRAQTKQAPVTVELEAGAFAFTRNDVRDPGDAGTPFAFDLLHATGPAGYFRLYLDVRPSPRQMVRFVYAPLRVSGTGALTRTTLFAGGTFAAGRPTRGTYRFNTYRANWRYALHQGPRWTLQLGAGLLVRDASIELRQPSLDARDENVGVVPLAVFSAVGRLSAATRVAFDFEGLGAKQGRALDGSVKLLHDLTPHVQVGIGYRALEGGVDVRSVYNFAFIHYGLASIAYNF